MISRRKLIAGAAAVAGASVAGPRGFALVNGTGELRPFDVRRFGAKGDGRTLDTVAVQAAIDACSKVGGGEVAVSSGATCLIGTVYLRNHVRLLLEPNATLLGSDDLGDYANDVGLNPFYPETIDPCLIYAKGATGIGISGGGRIIGHTNKDFIAPAGVTGRAALQRPMLIRFEGCTQISVTDVSFYRCGSWCMHLKNSSEIFLRGVSIQNEKQDGFDLESCQNASISDCQLDCGDDAIAITTSSKDHPSRNITITNCLLKSRCAGIRFGPLSKGDFTDIAVSNCVFYDCLLGGIKLGIFEGATIRDCVFSNLVMENVSAPISMFIATWPEIGSTNAQPPMMPPGKIRDLQFRGIRAVTMARPPDVHPDAGTVCFFQGHPQSSIENILLSDISITFAGGGTRAQAERREIVDMDQIDWRKDGYWTDHKSTWGVPPAYGLYARHVKGLTMANVMFQLATPDERSAIFLFDSENVRIDALRAAASPTGDALLTARNAVDVRLSHIEAAPSAGSVLRVEGMSSKEIVLEDVLSGNVRKPVEYADGATQAAVNDRRR